MKKSYHSMLVAATQISPTFPIEFTRGGAATISATAMGFSGMRRPPRSRRELNSGPPPGEP